MRHRTKGRKLNRTASHRKALLRNLANQLIEHKEIKTTTAKAKEARSTVERLITYAKKGDLHHRRLAFGFLRSKDSIKILFDELAPAYSERQGGYTRVLKLGRRQGDSASLSLLQLVGFEKLTDTSKPEKKKKSTKKEAPETQVEKTTPVKDTEEVVKDEAIVEEVSEQTIVDDKPEENQPEEAVVEEKPEETATEEASEPVETEEKSEQTIPETKAEESVAEEKPEEDVKPDEPQTESEEKEEDKKDKA